MRSTRTVTQIVERGLIENARRLGERLHRRLLELYDRFPIIGDVRGLGLLQGVGFVQDRRTREPFAPCVRPAKLVERAARERGLLLRCGEDFAAFAPPLVVTADQIDEMCGILGQSIEATQEQLL